MVSVLTDPCDCPISRVWARPRLGAPTIRWFDIFRVEFRGGGRRSRPKLIDDDSRRGQSRWHTEGESGTAGECLRVAYEC